MPRDPFFFFFEAELLGQLPLEILTVESSRHAALPSLDVRSLENSTQPMVYSNMSGKNYPEFSTVLKVNKVVVTLVHCSIVR